MGNLMAGLVTEDALRQLFNSTMRAAYPAQCPPGMEPVVSVSLHSEGRYAFVELRTPEMASAALQLSNQVLCPLLCADGALSGVSSILQAAHCLLPREFPTAFQSDKLPLKV